MVIPSYLPQYLFKTQLLVCVLLVGKLQKTLQFAPQHIYIRGHAVVQLVEALRYKPESCGFNS